MKNTIIHIILLIFYLQSCSPKLEEKYQEYSFSNSESIENEGIYLNDEYLLFSDKLICYNDKLVSINSKSDKYFDVLQLTDFEYMGSCGEKGGGPEEFNHINTKCCGQYKGNLFILENYKCTFFNIKVKDDSIRTIKKDKMMIIPEINVSNSLIVLNDTTLITYSNNNHFDEFIAYNPRSYKFEPINKYSSFHDIPGITSNAMGSVYLNQLVYSEKTQCFAAVYSYYPMIKIFNAQMECIAISILDNWKEQKFTYQNEGININDSYRYYLDACATNDYIYGLYIGKKMAELADKDPNSVPLYLHVWDWNGKPVKSLKLDHFVNKITADQNNTIYGYSMMCADTLFTYKLNKI